MWILLNTRNLRRPSPEVVSDWLLGNGISWERVWGKEDVDAVTQLTSSLVLQLASVHNMSCRRLESLVSCGSLSLVLFVNNVI
jgi:hypothetical protein